MKINPNSVQPVTKSPSTPKDKPQDQKQQQGNNKEPGKGNNFDKKA